MTTPRCLMQPADFLYALPDCLRLRQWVVIVRLLAAVAGVFLGSVRAEELAARVIVLANSDDPDSGRVAEHYAAVRGVPKENIIALPLAAQETISWREFVETIWEPLRLELVKRKWIDAIPMKLTDEVGRTKIAVFGHRISYLVVCRGVPLRIVHEPTLFAANLPLTNNPIFRTNAGAVDSELALLAHENYSINAFLGNPLFGNDDPTLLEASEVIKVSRLDGPSMEDALRLVDRAVAAERSGLLGRAYIDLGGNHPDGDRWLQSAARQLGDAAFDTDVDRAPGTMRAFARFDSPVLYFGWYSSQVDGPFALPGFHFPPGAIALHIHSYSAETLRSANAHWVGPLIARGVTATIGNVFEPYLQLTHRPDLLLRALMRGDTWGDAVCYAEPALSWESIAIGDPLYRPFAVTLETQWKNRAALPAETAGYLVVRRMLELEGRHRKDEALALGRSEQRKRPSFVLGIALANRFQAAGDLPAAAHALLPVAKLGNFRTDQWALAHEAADKLGAADRAGAAVDLYRALFGAGRLPRELRIAWLPGAIRQASMASDLAQADRWESELRELKAQ